MLFGNKNLLYENYHLIGIDKPETDLTMFKSVLSFPLIPLKKLAMKFKLACPGWRIGIGLIEMSKNWTCGEPQSVHSNLVYSALDKANKAARPKITKAALILFNFLSTC